MNARHIVVAQIAALILYAMPIPASAVTISTAEYLSASSNTPSRVEAFTQRAEVKAKLLELGVHPRDVQGRIDALSPSELAALEKELESLPAGGDVLGLIGAVFVVLLVLELVGVTDVFSGI